jgi:DNA polymerase-3 subunit delta'
MSRLYLCDNGRGDDGCGGCRGWRRDEKGLFRHPDLIVVGEFDKAANVEACRGLIKELHLKPVEAKRRLGAVLAADRLLPHAANSLLKVAEEPPSHGCLFFLMEGGDFLPTLRSRSRFTTLTAPPSEGEAESRPLPDGEEEWLEWLKNLKDDEDIPGILSLWVSHFLGVGKQETAARVEKLRLLVLQKKLSQTMTCDLLILALKEDLPFEHILGGLR